VNVIRKEEGIIKKIRRRMIKRRDRRREKEK
jgi:hypothetical protein